MFYNYIPYVFSVGGVKIHVYGLMIAIAVIVAAFAAQRLARRKGVPEDAVWSLALWGLFAGVVGARAIYVLFDLPYFAAHPREILSISEGGLSIHGAFLGGALVCLLVARRHGVGFWRLADVVAPSLALGEAIGRIGCDIYGKPADAGVLFARIVGGQAYYNIPLYTGVASLVVFLILWRWWDLKPDGRLFLRYVALFSVTRFFIEFYRTSQSAFGLMTVAQLTSIILAFAAVAAGWYLSRRQRA